MKQLTDKELFTPCQCGHDRTRHYGYTGQDGVCGRCYCPHFTPRTPAVVEAEVKLVNVTLEAVFDAMAPATRKAA